MPQATEIRSGPGVHPPRRGRVGVGKLARHIAFALHLRTSPFLQLGEFSAEFGPVSTLLGNLRGTKILAKNHLKIIIFFVSIFGWILNGFWLTFGTHFPCFFEAIPSHVRVDFSLILDRLLDKHTLGEMHSTQ